MVVGVRVKAGRLGRTRGGVNRWRGVQEWSSVEWYLVFFNHEVGANAVAMKVVERGRLGCRESGARWVMWGSWSWRVAFRDEACPCLED